MCIFHEHTLSSQLLGASPTQSGSKMLGLCSFKKTNTCLLNERGGQPQSFRMIGCVTTEHVKIHRQTDGQTERQADRQIEGLNQ